MIDGTALGFALGAGLVAALNPCGFAFLPGYLGLVIAGTSQVTRPVALARAGVATLAMSAGFLTVFGGFGLVISPLIASAQKYLPFATVIIGVLLIGLGAWMLSGREITVMMPRLSGGAPTTTLRTMYGYGVGYAVASLSCTVAPFLAVISTTFRQGSTLTGILAFVAYAGGMAITVGVAALAVALAGSSAAGVMRRVLPHVGRIAGAIVFLTGLYVTYYGYYEIRLYFLGAGPDDPIVEFAGAIQSWLVRRVDALGAWPLLGVLAALAAAAVVWQIRARRCQRNRGPAAGGAGSRPAARL
jgi:cytochrome c biogenesis protein CcdA